MHLDLAFRGGLGVAPRQPANVSHDIEEGQVGDAAAVVEARALHTTGLHLEQEKARGVEGTCFNYGSSISYLPFLDIVRHVCGLTGSDAEAAAKRQIEMHLTALGLESAAVSPYL